MATTSAMQAVRGAPSLRYVMDKKSLELGLGETSG